MKYYSIYCDNKQTGNLRIVNIFDDKRLADAQLQICVEKASQYQNFYIVELSCKDFHSIVDDKLINCCKIVADCLYLFDKAANKNNRLYHSSKFWFERAISNCKVGASILSFL